MSENDFYEQARQREHQYANTITMLGYGGFFALWATTHADMPRWLFSSCGLLMGISILFFVGWEIAKTHVVDRAYFEVTATDEHGNPTFRGDAARHINAKLNRMNRFHPYVFWTSTATGIISGFALLGFFIWHLSTMPIEPKPAVQREAAQIVERKAGAQEAQYTKEGKR